MKHKNLLILISIACLILILANPVPSQVKPKPVRIGFMFDLTGVFSAMGKDTQNTTKIMVDWINKSGGIKGHPIEFVIHDGESNATKGALTAKKLIEVEKVHVIQGCNGTGVALAVGPVCEENKVPFVTASASEVFEETLKPRWSFRATWKGWEQVDLMLGMGGKLDPKNKKIGILYQGAAFGKALYDNAVYYAPKRGLEIVAAEKYDPAGTDFGAQISTLMRANPDFVIVFCADMAGVLAMKQMREMGMNKPIVVNGAIVVKAIREAFKDTFSIPPYVYVSGSKPDVWWQLPKDSQDYKIIAPIASLYEKTFEDQFTGIHGVAMSGLFLIKDGIERAINEDPNLLDRDLKTIQTVIRDKMEATKNLNTGMGIITMAPNDHCGMLPGSGFAPFHYEKGKNVYDLKLSDLKPLAPPPTKK